MFDPSLLELNGSRSLVFGATGGLGKDIALALKGYGQDVFGIGRNKTILTQLREAGVETETFNIANEKEIVAFLKSCTAFDNVIFCNGINGPRPSRMCNDEFVRGVIDINLVSTINIVSNIIRGRKISSPGRIVFLSSIACHIAATNNAPYSASKGGGEAFFRGVARELLHKDITVNSIAPAAIDTPLFEGNRPAILNPVLYPLGSGKPEDVTNAVLFLLQKGSRFITGETLVLDGGASWLE